MRPPSRSLARRRANISAAPKAAAMPMNKKRLAASAFTMLSDTEVLLLTTQPGNTPR